MRKQQTIAYLKEQKQKYIAKHNWECEAEHIAHFVEIHEKQSKLFNIK